MSIPVRSWIYPGALTTADIAIGALCYTAGAVGVAVLLWATAIVLCLGLLSRRWSPPAVAGPA